MAKLLNIPHDNTDSGSPRAFKRGDRVTVGSESGTVWAVEANGYQVSFDFTQGRRASLINFDNDPPMLLERSDSKAPPLETDLTTKQRSAVKILEELSAWIAHFVWDWQGNTRAYGSVDGVEWSVDAVGDIGLMLEIGSSMCVSIYPKGSDTPGVNVHWESSDGKFGTEAVQTARRIAKAFLDNTALVTPFEQLLERASENDELRAKECAERIATAFYSHLEGLPYLLQVTAKRQALELIRLAERL